MAWTARQHCCITELCVRSIVLQSHLSTRRYGTVTHMPPVRHPLVECVENWSACCLCKKTPLYSHVLGCS